MDACEIAAGLLGPSNGRGKLNSTLLYTKCDRPSAQSKMSFDYFKKYPSGPRPDTPVGYCGVQFDGEEDIDGTLVIYTDADSLDAGSKMLPRHCYAGKRFVPLCKMLICSPTNEIEGDGAARPFSSELGMSRAPAADDNAKCVPNSLQVVEWQEEESDKYYSYWLAGIVFGSVYALSMFIGAFLYFPRNAQDTKGVQLCGTTFKPKVDSLRWLKLQIFGPGLLLFRVGDCATDWLLFALSINTERFKYSVEQSSYDIDFDTYVAVSLAVCILSVPLFLLDLYGFGFKMKSWYETKSTTKTQPGGCIHAISLAVVLVEDLPQTVLNTMQVPCAAVLLGMRLCLWRANRASVGSTSSMHHAGAPSRMHAEPFFCVHAHSRGMVVVCVRGAGTS